MNMDITATESGLAQIVSIAGNIDGSTAAVAQKAVMDALTRGNALVVDMTETRYMSSAGLRMLLIVHRESVARQSKLVLTGVRPELQDVMNATGFLRFFTLATNVDAGLKLVAS